MFVVLWCCVFDLLCVVLRVCVVSLFVFLFFLPLANRCACLLGWFGFLVSYFLCAVCVVVGVCVFVP